MSAVQREAGLYVLTAATVARIEGTPNDWIDENLQVILAGVERVLREEPGTPNAMLAREALRHVRELAAYRQPAMGPALFAMMSFMHTVAMLDTNLSYEPAVRARAKSAANLRKACITREQALGAIARSPKMSVAAKELGVSVRTLQNRTTAAERTGARAARR